MFIVFQSLAYPMTARVASIVVTTYLYAHATKDVYQVGKFANRKVQEWKARRLRSGSNRDIGPSSDVQPC